MDRFAWGAVVIAVVLEGFVVWGWTGTPQDEGNLGKLALASVFPLVLLGVTLFFYKLQKA